MTFLVPRRGGETGGRGGRGGGTGRFFLFFFFFFGGGGRGGRGNRGGKPKGSLGGGRPRHVRRIGDGTRGGRGRWGGARGGGGQTARGFFFSGGGGGKILSLFFSHFLPFRLVFGFGEGGEISGGRAFMLHKHGGGPGLGHMSRPTGGDHAGRRGPGRPGGLFRGGGGHTPGGWGPSGGGSGRVRALPQKPGGRRGGGGGGPSGWFRSGAGRGGGRAMCSIFSCLIFGFPQTKRCARGQRGGNGWERFSKTGSVDPGGTCFGGEVWDGARPDFSSFFPAGGGGPGKGALVFSGLFCGGGGGGPKKYAGGDFFCSSRGRWWGGLSPGPAPKKKLPQFETSRLFSANIGGKHRWARTQKKRGLVPGRSQNLQSPGGGPPKNRGAGGGDGPVGWAGGRGPRGGGG